MPRSTSVPEMPIYHHHFQKVDCNFIRNELRGIDQIQARNWLYEQSRTYFEQKQYWVGLFKQYGIKLYTSWYKYGARHCVITDALREIGGISTIYQRAIEEFPSAETIVDVDVLFSFSAMAADIERKSLSKIPYLVVTGYLGDFRIDLVKDMAREVRATLHKNGAQKIITFFDENSSSNTRWYIDHDFMRVNYEFLLNKVLEEPWLGIVFKPKTPHTLSQRLGPVNELLQKAKQTGRVYIFDQGSVQGSYPPVLAALASDIAIHGHCCAATAGLEAALAGVPTILIDREGWPHSMFYKLGKNKVVFNEWPDVWQACKDYLRNPSGMEGFGDWSPIIDELDPFRDGKAALRMATYLQWIHEGLNKKLPREIILSDCAERYAKQWGRDKIFSINR
jgi:hypothetical protein